MATAVMDSKKTIQPTSTGSADTTLAMLQKLPGVQDVIKADDGSYQVTRSIQGKDSQIGNITLGADGKLSLAGGWKSNALFNATKAAPALAKLDSYKSQDRGGGLSGILASEDLSRAFSGIGGFTGAKLNPYDGPNGDANHQGQFMISRTSPNDPNKYNRAYVTPDADGKLGTIKWGGDESDKTDTLIGSLIPALAIAAVPGLNASIGSIYGLTGGAASIAGGATVGGVVSGIQGNSVLTGALGGGIAGAAPVVAGGLKVAGVDPTIAKLLAKATTGAAGAVVKGGNAGVGALTGAVGVNTGTASDSFINFALKNIVAQKVKG